MWPELRRAGLRIFGIAFGVVLAAVIILEGADKIWPDFFVDRETAELRRVLRDDLARLTETVAAHEVLLNKRRRAGGEAPVRKLPPSPWDSPYEEIPPAKLYKLKITPGDPKAPDEDIRSIRVRDGLRWFHISLQAETVSGKTGLIGGRKVDYRKICLPIVDGVDYSYVYISRINAEGQSVQRMPLADAPGLPDDAFDLLTSRRPRDRRTFSRKFGSGCYSPIVQGNESICVVAVAVSGDNLGRGSVEATRCRIEAKY